MRLSTLLLALTASLSLAGGCASTQDVETARADTEALRGEIAGVNTGLTATIQKLRDDLVETDAFTEEQVAVLDGWQAEVVEHIDTATGAVAAKIDPILESLEPADVTAVGEGISATGRVVGGPIGTGLGILGALLVGVSERRGRNRAVRGTVASVESARGTDGVVDFRKAAELQALLGIRREVRNATEHASAIIGSVSSKPKP